MILSLLCDIYIYIHIYDSCIFYSNAQLKPKNTWIPIEIVSLSFVKIHVGYEVSALRAWAFIIGSGP
jgi:hypothetical protein